MDSQLPPEAQQAPSASLQEGESTSLYYDREPEDHLPGGSPDDLSAFPQAEAAFLSSQPLPQVPAHPPLHATHPLAPRPAPRRRFPVLAIVCITALIALTLGLLAVSVEAIATPQFGVSTATHPPARLAPTSRPPTKNQPKGGATPVPTMTPVPNTQPADWVPMPLPPGWTNANLSTGDALEAERTAMTFTDREMSLDYRAVGTRGQHGGTLTASVFILTTAARQRFQQNDVRVVDTVLFDSVERSQLIQAVINGVPHLVQFQAQNQQQFAWVDVSFQLWQSQLDPQNAGQRLEGKNSDPATGQPRTHHMLVLLVRVPPGTQGANAPMGGTGWLVSNYALDAAAGALPMIVQPA